MNHLSHATFPFKMVIKYRDKEISSLEDIQKLRAKDLREILKSNSELASGMKADLVLKVYALLMWDVLPTDANSGENEEVLPQDLGDCKYDAAMRRITALGWSTDLRQLPEMNFIQLYDYLVVSTRKYRQPHRSKGNTLQEIEIVSVFLPGKREKAGKQSF